MRRSREEAARTRARIVEAAANAFRRHGINQAGIATVMDEAGLTHGGFYKHFESKDQLIAEACEQIFRSVLQQLAAQVAPLPPERRLAAFIELYLSAWHRDHREQGCGFAALGTELAHACAAVRAAADRGLRQLINTLAGFLPDAGQAQRNARAQAIAATLAGAMMLARAVGDPALSDAMLVSARDSLLARAA